GQDLPSEVTHCSHVIQAETPLMLQDSSLTVFGRATTARTGVSFYAGAPLRMRGGIVVGTLCIVDREPRSVHADDLSVLEMLAMHGARLIEAQAGYGRASPSAFVVPDVMTRSVFRHMVGAELSRINRDGGGMELGLIDVGLQDRELLQRAAKAINARA